MQRFYFLNCHQNCEVCGKQFGHKINFFLLQLLFQDLCGKGEYFQRKKCVVIHISHPILIRLNTPSQLSYISIYIRVYIHLYIYTKREATIKMQKLRTKLCRKRVSFYTNLQSNLSISVKTSITPLFFLKIPNIKLYEHSYSDCRQETRVKMEGRADRNMNGGSEET